QLSVSIQGNHASRHLLSFPTRRSSDLATADIPEPQWGWSRRRRGWSSGVGTNLLGEVLVCQTESSRRVRACGRIESRRPRDRRRSEEHTSELQSRRDLVCRLLLEKKKR